MATKKKGSGGGGGKKSGRKSSGGSLLNAPLDAVGSALRQGQGIASEVAERASSLGRAALESASNTMESVSPTAAELIRPAGARGGKKSSARTSNKRKASKVGSGTSGAAKQARKATREAGKAARAVGSATRAVATTATRGAASRSAGKSGGKSSKGGAKKR